MWLVTPGGLDCGRTPNFEEISVPSLLTFRPIRLEIHLSDRPFSSRHFKICVAYIFLPWSLYTDCDDLDDMSTGQ